MSQAYKDNELTGKADGGIISAADSNLPLEKDVESRYYVFTSPDGVKHNIPIKEEGGKAQVIQSDNYMKFINILSDIVTKYAADFNDNQVA